MSHFYGSIPVSARKTTPTACAHKSTGLSVLAASWAGAVEVELYHDEETGKDHFVVYQRAHFGSGINKEIARGVVGAE